MSCAITGRAPNVAADAAVPTTKLRRSIFFPSVLVPVVTGLMFGPTTASSLHAPDRDHRFVDPLTVDIPELLEVRTIKIGEFLAEIGDRGNERVGMGSLVDWFAQWRPHLFRHPFGRENPAPEVVFDVGAQLFKCRHVRQRL